jgi:hypothetical protein
VNDDLQSLLRFAVLRERLERATFVGPMAEYRPTMELLNVNGWHITRSGCYTDRKMFPRCDTARFKITAECVIKVEPPAATRRIARRIRALKSPASEPLAPGDGRIVGGPRIVVLPDDAAD